ncbi:hypothetical protein GUJ93_ZPchr0009g964 [Zizania palustris]|uniref:Uncharacterized protein n=1 Tax=Zizania palustris TaxID=103762 RepID=A0A8J5RQK9_ZIZPA|nr:hypothetical protein GUJ93_ZPchr0009g964 [Zizania palustris]
MMKPHFSLFFFYESDYFMQNIGNNTPTVVPRYSKMITFASLKGFENDSLMSKSLGFIEYVNLEQVFDRPVQHDPLDFEGLGNSRLCAEPFDLGQLGPERIGFGDMISKPLDLGRLILEFISFSGPSPELPDLSNLCLGANDFCL